MKNSGHRSRDADASGMVLNRYLALSGLGSRRQCAEYVVAGRVTVNGKKVMQPYYRVRKGEVVRYLGKPVFPEKKYYVLLNKPRGVVTTCRDERNRTTVLDLVPLTSEVRLFPVGRLDRDTSGVLLLTNDGALAHKLLHPAQEVSKVYRVTLDKPVSPAHLEQLRHGITLDDGLARVDDIAWVEGAKKNVVGVQIHSGRNRLVRRMFEYLGYEVRKLDRTLFAGLTKRKLPPGKWRFLTPSELNRLKRIT